LVTGAGGFIGRHSIAPLRAAGYEVHAVLSHKSVRANERGAAVSARAAGPAHPGAQVHLADLLDPEAVNSLIETIRPTHLLHFAWIATPGLYWNSAENYPWLEASQHLLLRFQDRGGIRAVMAGSCAEYDWSRVGICDERSSPLADASGTAIGAYAACKIAMQQALEKFGRAHDLSTAWGRIFFQFGPGEHPRRLVASVIIDLLSGREALCSHGRQIRSFLHVADVGAAFAAVLDSELEGPVNIGSGERISIAELLGRIARTIGRPELLKFGARHSLPFEPDILVPDIRRLRQEVGWKPRLTLDGGLADAIDWWRGQLIGGADRAPVSHQE
jgi:nucleoside-diphosphate-sugar epimerase